ncbi:hypothetical protein F66182_1063 [Fusarium sp. NRRL 66182]|nr:hypothetical protein F66182_1063 [Fusarium sp. NRRL 66182]
MASNSSATSCIRPPSSLLIEKPYKQDSHENYHQDKHGSCAIADSLSPQKTFSSRTRREPQDHFSSSNSVVVRSVGLPTPPTSPHKSSIKTQHTIKPAPVPIFEYDQEPLTIHLDEFNGPPAIGDPEVLTSPNHTFDKYPPPSREEYPEDGDIVFKPGFIHHPHIGLANPIARFEQTSRINFVEPLALQGAVRDEYAAHANHEKEERGHLLNEVHRRRVLDAEFEAARIFDFNFTDEPVSLPVMAEDAQRAIYNLEADYAALSRKVALCDAAIEGAIAGEFTYNWDTCHLPPTEDQMSVLREAESLRGLFPEVKPTPPRKPELVEKSTPPKGTQTRDLYEQFLGNQSSACPASDWLKEEQAFAMKKAYQDASSGQRDMRFPSLVKSTKSRELDKEFPYNLPNSRKDPYRNNGYQSSPSVQVPKWFPTFASYNIIRIDRRQKPADQYKELLTAVWKLEAQMKCGKQSWGKKWHDPSPRWTEPWQKTSGG